MAKKQVKYTLWTIPKASWSSLLHGIEVSEDNQNDLVSFALELDDERLSDRLQPFDTPVTQNTLNTSVGPK